MQVARVFLIRQADQSRGQGQRRARQCTISKGNTRRPPRWLDSDHILFGMFLALRPVQAPVRTARTALEASEG